MSLVLLIKGERLAVSPPTDRGGHGTVPGNCPCCDVTPFAVARVGSVQASDDDRAWEAGGVCVSCRVFVGTLREEADTIFGVREDAKALAGPWRVY